jgi:hypothetical protein
VNKRTATVVAAIGIALTAGLITAVVLGGLPGAGSTAALASPTPSPTPSPTATPSPRPSPSPSPTASPSPSPTPDRLAADLTGLLVPRDLAHRMPIAVVIDDNRIARPQSGFNGASLVYQAPADGGETRYLFVYQEGDSRDIGPVRSGRIYLAEWASELRAVIGHYGGDRKTRRWLQVNHGKKIWSIDGIRRGNPPYHRIKSRRAPHNAYTSTAALRDVARRIGAPATIAADVFVRPFADEGPADGRPATQTIRIPYRTGLVTYAYDPKSNLYLRSLDGRAQKDPTDGKRVTTRNVVILFMSFRIDAKIEPGHARPVVGSIGSGKAWIFREGQVVSGTWRKRDATGPTRLFDSAGHEIPLIRGRTFFQIVPLGTKVSHGR